MPFILSFSHQVATDSQAGNFFPTDIGSINWEIAIWNRYFSFLLLLSIKPIELGNNSITRSFLAHSIDYSSHRLRFVPPSMPPGDGEEGKERTPRPLIVCNQRDPMASVCLVWMEVQEVHDYLCAPAVNGILTENPMASPRYPDVGSVVGNSQGNRHWRRQWEHSARNIVWNESVMSFQLPWSHK